MTIKNREKFLTFLTIGIVALFAADRLVLTPLIAAWKTRNDQIRELRKDVNKGTFLLERDGAIRDRWARMKTNALPSDVSLAQDGVFKAAYRWAGESKFGLTSVKPQKKQADDYMIIDCRADGAGTIDTVMRFLYEIEQDPLALRIEDLEITARDNAGQQLSLGVRFSGLLLQTEEK